MQTSGSDVYFFFTRKDIVHWSKNLSDKGMAYWNLHTNFQLPSAMGLRDFDFQSQAVLMGGSPLSQSAMVKPWEKVSFRSRIFI